MEKNEKNSQDLSHVYGDVVSVKQLIFSIALSVALALIGYIAAPDQAPLPLAFGFGGVIIATIINSLLYKPKRNIEIIGEAD